MLFTLNNIIVRIRLTNEKSININVRSSMGKKRTIHLYQSDHRYKLISKNIHIKNVEQKLFSEYSDYYDVIIDAGANYGQFLLEIQSTSKEIYISLKLTRESVLLL